MTITDSIILDDAGVARCRWCAGDALYERYHDCEWGFPSLPGIDLDTRLFEKICLEGFQAGLSWLTILRKRENFRRAFRGFDIDRVARMTRRDVERLLGNAGIVRHRGKIESTINNARRAIDVREACGSLAAFVWRFQADPSPPARRTLADVPAQAPESKDGVEGSKSSRSPGMVCGTHQRPASSGGSRKGTRPRGR